jgi:hypothetical protein
VVEFDRGGELSPLFAGGSHDLAEPSHARRVAQHTLHQSFSALGAEEGVDLSRGEHKVLHHQVL